MKNQISALGSRPQGRRVHRIATDHHTAAAIVHAIAKGWVNRVMVHVKGGHREAALRENNAWRNRHRLGLPACFGHEVNAVVRNAIVTIQTKS